MLDGAAAHWVRRASQELEEEARQRPSEVAAPEKGCARPPHAAAGCDGTRCRMGGGVCAGAGRRRSWRRPSSASQSSKSRTHRCSASSTAPRCCVAVFGCLRRVPTWYCLVGTRAMPHPHRDRGSPLPHPHRDQGSPLPHPHWDGAHCCHICTGDWAHCCRARPATSSPGLGSPVPHLRRVVPRANAHRTTRHWARPHIA